MAVEQYKLQYLVDWELTIPSQLSPAEQEVVSAFLENKHVGYTMEGDKYSSKLTSANSCTILQINDREIKLRHHSNKPIICKNINQYIKKHLIGN